MWLFTELSLQSPSEALIHQIYGILPSLALQFWAVQTVDGAELLWSVESQIGPDALFRLSVNTRRY
jgi:hypothetical protein